MSADSIDNIDNSDTYIFIFEASDGKEIIRGDVDGLSNSLIFRAPSGETYADADFQSNRGFWGEEREIIEANDSGSLPCHVRFYKRIQKVKEKT